MKRFLTVLAIVGLAVIFTTAGWAGVLQPRADGNNVLVPDMLVKAIPGFDATKPVYAACDVNRWFSGGAVTDNLKIATKMQKIGDNWVATGLTGYRFHPVQLGKDGKPKWAKVENLYPLNSAFVDMSTGSPCLLVK